MIDLHSHTWLSDGHLGPAQLIARAESVGVRHLAITDHDCIAAHTQIQSGAVSVPQSMDIISGVEISTVWENQEIHIIGLLVETENSNLNQLLESQQERRRDRAGAIDKKLQRAGICGLSAYLSEQPCQAVGRNHVADFLISQSVVSSKQQAFTRYLAKRGNAYVSASWCTIDEAVAAIAAASSRSLRSPGQGNDWLTPTRACCAPVRVWTSSRKNPKFTRGSGSERTCGSRSAAAAHRW